MTSLEEKSETKDIRLAREHGSQDHLDLSFTLRSVHFLHENEHDACRCYLMA